MLKEANMLIDSWALPVVMCVEIWVSKKKVALNTLNELLLVIDR